MSNESERRRRDRRTMDRRLGKRPDFHKLANYVRIYAEGVNINCMVLKTLNAADYENRNPCQLCKRISEMGISTPHCSNWVVEQCSQSEQYMEPYVFQCPMGLYHFVEPIFWGNGQNTYLLAGPLLTVTHDVFINNPWLRQQSLNAKICREISRILNQVPNCTKERLNSLVELFHIMVNEFNSQCYNINMYQNHLLQQGNIDAYFQEMWGETWEISPMTKEREKDLTNAVHGGNKLLSQSIINQIMDEINCYAEDFVTAHNQSLDLVLMLYRVGINTGLDGEQFFGVNYVYLQEVRQIDNKNDLHNWLKNITARFVECIFSFIDIKHREVIHKSIDYIKQNYMHKIFLEDVAAHVFLSPSYFSKIFGEEMQCKFNTYLNKVRINNAQCLLREEDVHLSDIAYMVGFEDQSYFSKVFRRITGTTPRNFRTSCLEVKKNIKDIGTIRKKNHKLNDSFDNIMLDLD